MPFRQVLFGCVRSFVHPIFSVHLCLAPFPYAPKRNFSRLKSMRKSTLSEHTNAIVLVCGGERIAIGNRNTHSEFVLKAVFHPFFALSFSLTLSLPFSPTLSTTSSRWESLFVRLTSRKAVVNTTTFIHLALVGIKLRILPIKNVCSLDPIRRQL